MQAEERKVYIASIIILLIAAVFSTGYPHPDEHFQILEPAWYMLGFSPLDNLPWEYFAQMRSSAQPDIVLGLYPLLKLFGLNNPFTLTFLIRLLSASLSFLSMWLLYKVYSKNIIDLILKKWFLLLSFLLWFLVYNSVRFSSENWSGLFFTIPFALYFLIERRNIFSYLGIGMLLGFSFLFRYQVGFLIAGFLAWIAFVNKEKFLNIIYLAAGFIAVIFFGILLDRRFYGEWTITIWNYFEQNIVQNKASIFGTEPWYYYLEAFFIQAFPLISLLFILSIIIMVIFKRKSPIIWCVLPFLAVHFIIPHKELRFLFPMAGFLPIITIKSFEVIQEKFVKNFSEKKYLKIFMKVFFITNFLLLIVVAFKPAGSNVSLFRKIYDGYKAPATLYFIKDNPYQGALNIYFYKRNNLEIRQIDSFDSIKSEPGRKNLIVFTFKNRYPEFEKKNKLIYSSYPDWMTKYNFNNWLDRSPVWFVYEVKN